MFLVVAAAKMRCRSCDSAALRPTLLLLANVLPAREGFKNGRCALRWLRLNALGCLLGREAGRFALRGLLRRLTQHFRLCARRCCLGRLGRRSGRTLKLGARRCRVAAEVGARSRALVVGRKMRAYSRVGIRNAMPVSGVKAPSARRWRTATIQAGVTFRVYVNTVMPPVPTIPTP